MKIEEYKERKRELGYSNKRISELSGIPLGTLQKVFSGETKSPRYETVQALENVLGYQTDAPESYESRSANRRSVSAKNLHEAIDYLEAMRAAHSDSTYVREPNLARTIEYSANEDNPSSNEGSPEEQLFGNAGRRSAKEYTIEDYYAISNERRVELIDGIIYEMTAPTFVHQYLAGEVFSRMRDYRRKQRASCMPILAPIDVQPDDDDRTMVQPDLIVVCDKKKNLNKVVHGAPDFVMEVLSPSTRKMDVLLKLNKYWRAGVREYWIVDPEEEKVTVYDFEHGRFPIQYSFSDEVPVAISEGGLAIDFAEIRRELEEYNSL